MDLVRSSSTELAGQAANKAQQYLRCARARNTIIGYRSSYRQFEQWCQGAGLLAMPRVLPHSLL